MAFIHKNVNSALLMLITFLSVALVTATVYSVQAFDSLNVAYSEKAMEAETLASQLKEHEVMADSLKQTAELTQEREAALAQIVEKQRQEAAQPQTEQAIQVSSEPAPKTAYNVNKQPYNPYRQKYWGWNPTKRYVI